VNDTPLGFGGTTRGVAFGLVSGADAGIGLLGELVASKLGLATTELPTVLGEAVCIEAGEAAPLALHAPITAATITTRTPRAKAIPVSRMHGHRQSLETPWAT
jgi:hypothetical protein